MPIVDEELAKLMPKKKVEISVPPKAFIVSQEKYEELRLQYPSDDRKAISDGVLNMVYGSSFVFSKQDVIIVK